MFAGTESYISDVRYLIRCFTVPADGWFSLAKCLEEILFWLQHKVLGEPNRGELRVRIVGALRGGGKISDSRQGLR